MKVSREQAMASVGDDRFIEWFVDEFMAEHFPEAFEGGERKALLQMNRHGLGYARHFGFKAREEQTHFLALMNDIAPDFWRFPGFSEIMEDRVLSPMERIDAVYDDISGAQFEAAVMESDPDYWFPHLVEDHPLLVE